MMPKRVMRRSSDTQTLPFILVGDPIMRKVVGVRGIAHLMGEIGCNT